MRAINYSEARQHLKTVMDTVCVDHVPTIITRKSGENVVMISTEDYDSLMETEYLLSSPANAKHLLESLEQAKHKKLTPLEKIKIGLRGVFE